jgi:hypothetical protein
MGFAPKTVHAATKSGNSTERPGGIQDFHSPHGGLPPGIGIKKSVAEEATLNNHQRRIGGD